MAVISQPNLLPGEFASDGDKNTIPANNDGLSGLASIAKGFPPITQQPLASGGLPPQRADFNGIFNLISQFLLYYQSGGVCSYNITLDYNPPAIVGDAEGNIYMCIAQNGPNTTVGVQEISNTSYWIKVITANSLSDSLEDYLPLSGGTLTGNLNASGNNITANDFIGNLQGTATKAQQDKNGLEIDSNYIKNIQNNNGVLTITKGNDTTSQLTINSVIATSNVPSNGWRKYQDNFIVEWGNKLNIPVNAQPTKIIFPVAVKTVLGAWATIQRGDIPNVVICPYLQSFDTNGMEVVIDYEIGQSFVPGSEITNVVWGIYGLL